jgi:teichuronic acid exporter
MLERKLEFGKFVIPQVLENVVYNISLVYFAWKGYGITSFTFAVLIRGIVGLVAIYVLQPWKPGIALSRISLKSLLKFGVPYQLNNFLATVKDDGLTIVLGGILGNFGLGILGTAQKLAQYPLRFFMDNVTKVTFPAFSRMQDDKDDLTRSLNRSIFFICALVYPSLIGLISLFPILIYVIPKYQKWAPTFIPLIFLSYNSALAAVTTQLTNLLTSVGRIKTVLKLMIMWTSLSWIFLPFLSAKWGVNGTALGYAIVGSSSFIVFYILKKYINWSIINSAVKPLLASLLMGLVLFIAKGMLSYNILSFILLMLLGILIYAVSLYILIGSSLKEDVKKTITSVFSR